MNMKTVTKPILRPSNEKIWSVDRLSVSITKRKRSTPQKFLGEFFSFFRCNVIHFLSECRDLFMTHYYLISVLFFIIRMIYCQLD